MIIIRETLKETPSERKVVAQYGKKKFTCWVDNLGKVLQSDDWDSLNGAYMQGKLKYKHYPLGHIDYYIS